MGLNGTNGIIDIRDHLKKELPEIFVLKQEEEPRRGQKVAFWLSAGNIGIGTVAGVIRRGMTNNPDQYLVQTSTQIIRLTRDEIIAEPQIH